MTDNNTQPRVGAGVLETLTTGMYRNPFDTLREYVQNAFDSIRTAERQKILVQGAGRIEVHIDTSRRVLTIRDNGVGIPSNDVYARLVNIGMSIKNLETDAGFRGIGRLAGIAYCEHLFFTTQAAGEQSISTVKFDACQLNKATSPSRRQVEELSDVIRRHVSIENQTSRNNSHFFEVRLEGINQAGELFLTQRQVHDYLSQVAPLSLDTHSFLMAGKFYDWVKARNLEIPTVSILIKYGNMSYELFKPYKGLTYATKQGPYKINVSDLRFFPEDAGPDSPFWIWYAKTNCPGAFAEETIGGFRLRKSNISIGLSERMTDIFRLTSESYARFNKYFMGEVHIQSSHVIPNAHRDDFEDTPEWIDIRNQLTEFVRERSKEAYELSAGRNADIEKLVSSADSHLVAARKKESVGLASKAEQAKLIEEHEKQIKKLEAAQKAERNEDDQKRLQTKLNELKKSRNAIETLPFTTNKLNTSLDNKQRKVISEILCILYEILDQSSFAKAQKAIHLKFGMREKEPRK